MRVNLQIRFILIMCSFSIGIQGGRYSAFGIQGSRYRRQPFGVKMCFDLCAKRDGCYRPVFIRDTLTCITQNRTDIDKGLGVQLKVNKSYTKDNSSAAVQIKPVTLDQKGKQIGQERTATSHKGMSSFGQKCSDVGVCIGVNTVCFKGTCLCTPGYRSVPTETSCNETCSKYGSTMTPYPGLAIRKHNRKEITASRMQCVKLCIKETSFTCVSVDTHDDLTCNLHQYGYGDVAGEYRETNQKRWIFYERNCAP